MLLLRSLLLVFTLVGTLAVRLNNKAREIFKCTPLLSQISFEVPSFLQDSVHSLAGNNTYLLRESVYSVQLEFNLLPHPNGTVNCEESSVKSYYLSAHSNASDYDANAGTLNGNVSFSTRGYLRVGNEYYSRDSYCISNITNSEIQVQTCSPDCTNYESACVRKCCPFGQVLAVNWSMTENAVNCVETDTEWQPYLYKQMEETPLPTFQRWGPGSSIHYEISKLDCEKRALSQSQSAQANRVGVRILQNGKILTKDSGNHGWRSPVHRFTKDKEEYCVDGLLDLKTAEKYIPDESNQVILVCQNSETPQNVRNRWMIFLFLSHVSSFMAFLTVTVHLLLWDKQNLHGWTVTMFSFCMMCKMVSVLLGYTVPLFHWVPRQTPTCIIMGVLKHFFDMSMFSWLIVICFDLWNTIRSLVSSDKRSKGYKKFFWYNCFGFGVPAIVISIALTMEFWFDVMDDRVVRPQYGRAKCALDYTSYGYYSVAPNFILYGILLIFSVFVFKTLYSTQQDANFARSSATTATSQSIATLYIKLCIVMGVPWIFDFFIYIVSRYFSWGGPWVPWTLNILNILQTVGIFIIFVCKPLTAKQLCEKYAFFKVTFRWLRALQKNFCARGISGCFRMQRSNSDSCEPGSNGSNGMTMTTQSSNISA